MALVTEILDRASRLTGLRTTGTEREIALQAINDVYHDVLMETTSVVYLYNHQFVGSTDAYPLLDDLSALTIDDIVMPDHMGLLSISYSDASGYSFPLKQVSEQEMLNYQRGLNVSGFTRIYSMLGHKIIRVYPRPNVGESVTIAYIPRPPELVECIDIAGTVTVTSASAAVVGVGTIFLSQLSPGDKIRISDDPSATVWTVASITDNLNLTLTTNAGVNAAGVEICEVSNAQTFSAIWGTSVWSQFSWGQAGTTGQIISETFPSLIPPQFHWSVLLPGVVVQLLDKDQRVGDVQFWQSRYQAGLNKMHEWMAQFGGDPAPIFDHDTIGFTRYPDQYSRGWS